MTTNSEVIRNKLVSLLGEVEDIIAPHMSTRADDDQYDDPELWWAFPVRDKIKQAIKDLDNN